MRPRPRTRLHAATAALVAVVAVAAAACTALIDVEDYHLVTADASELADALGDGSASPSDSGPPPPASDATVAPEDGAADSSADAETSAPVDASVPENLVTNPSFENKVVNGNCGIGWQQYYASTIGSSSVARSGSVSCMVCNSSDQLGYLGFDLVTPDAGSVLFASAYLSGIANADGGFATVLVGLSVCYQGCSTEFSAPAAPEVPGQWMIDQGPQVTVEQDAKTSQLQISVANGCILVDDVSVVAE